MDPSWFVAILDFAAVLSSGSGPPDGGESGLGSGSGG
jgi:hypothetical protein